MNYDTINTPTIDVVDEHLHALEEKIAAAFTHIGHAQNLIDNLIGLECDGAPINGAALKHIVLDVQDAVSRSDEMLRAALKSAHDAQTLQHVNSGAE